jgi:hypothetical protein
MHVGINQARDQVRSTEIPFAYAPVRSANTDNNAVFYRKIALLPGTGKGIENPGVPEDKVRWFRTKSCRDQRGMQGFHGVIP